MSPRLTRNQTPLFEIDHHLMNGGRRGFEVKLHVTLGRRATVELGVVVDEG